MGGGASCRGPGAAGRRNESMRPWPARLSVVAAACAAIMVLDGCATGQAQRNTTLMAATISRMRQDQALNNIAAAIDDRSFVPSAIVLGTGQATVASAPTSTLTPTIGNPSSLELGLGATYTVTAQWQFTSITDPDDLRRLRNIFALIVSTDAQFDELETYFHSAAASAARSGGGVPADRNELVYRNLLGSFAPTGPKPGAESARQAPSPEAAGQVVSWRDARRFLEQGDSIDCRLYQQAKPVSGKGLPFRRWLFWRKPKGGAWNPQPPPAGMPIETLGTYGNWELGVTSRACLDDFVILIQALTPNTNAAAAEGPKYMLR